jgi:hypothetical protein
MRRYRLPRAIAAALAALAAVLVLPGSGQHASATAARGTGYISASATNTAVTNTIAVSATSSASTTSAVTGADLGAVSGGLCSVPGIGDIGGLLGFCAAGSSGVIGAINNVCQPSLPDPEPANAGIDAMVAPPASGKLPATLYDQYGVAGDYWAATNLQCSDMTSLIGNNVAGMVFDAAKSIDRVTITVYQSAAGEGILSWLQRVTDKLITSLGNAIYFPYLAVVVILAAIWLAWQGLIRKRATRTIEGTVWMVVACAAAIFLIGKPADVTGLGRGVSDGISQALNAAFANLPSPGPATCVPVQKSDPQAQSATYSYTSGSTVVDQNADELWTVLVCKPWLVGEFGTSVFSFDGGKATAVNTYGRSLLWAQAIAVNEKATPALVQAKQDAFAGIASSIQTKDPAIYPLFQGKQWTTRLEVAFAALFAAVVAGVLVLLIAVTLILLKLSFLLLLIVGPFFLLIGVHPGFGRVVALRWVEMLIGVLLKQGAVALVLSVLLYCYALIMGTSDAVLPWALKILMIALVTVAAFIYRKPFQHLFSAVGYGVVGSQDRAEADLARAGAAARANTVAAATAALPGIAAYRAGRWARRNPGQAASLAMAATSGGTAAVAAGLQAGDNAAGGEGTVDADGMPVAAAGAGGQDGAGGRMALAARARSGAASAASSVSATAAAEAPPLNLPSRNGSGPAAGAATDTARGLSGSDGVSALVNSAARAASGSGGPGASALSADRGSARGTWPAGRGVSGASQESLRQPAGPPPRLASPPLVRPTPSQQSRSQSAGGEPAPLQPSASQRAPSPRARAQRAPSQRAQPQQPPREQAPQPQRARGQSPAAGRLRVRRSAASAPARPASTWQSQPASARRSQPSERGQSQTAQSQPAQGQAGRARSGRADADKQQTSSGERTSWQGQAMTGPLARPSAEPERQVPFWLRPMRRK